jgi:tetratricopeptide (TPR) repeat protein
MKSLKYIIPFIFLLFIGCEPDNSVSITELTADGWQLFIAGNYTDALEKFDKVLDEGGNDVEAYCGAGWCQLYIGNFAQAETAFVNSTASVFYADSYAGLTFAAMANNHFQLAIDAASALLYGAAIQQLTYQFQYDPSVDWWDVRLALAQAFFHMGDYDSCYGQIQTLDPLIVLDPDSETFVNDLLAALEQLEG